MHVLLFLLVCLRALFGNDLVLDVELQLLQVHLFVHVVVAADHSNVLIHMIGERSLLVRVFSHVGRDLARLQIEFLLRGLAQNISILVGPSLPLKLVLDHDRARNVVLNIS